MKSSLKKSVHARTLTFLTTTVLLFSLVGCSNTDDASPDLEETTDASASGAATEYVPASEEGPAENVPEPRLSSNATEYSEDGAKDTVEFFWEAEQHARLSGETRPLEMVSTEECEFCSESIDGWPASFREGVWSVTDDTLEVEVVDVRFEESGSEDLSEAYVFFKLHEPATSFYDEQGLRLEESFEQPEVKDWFALLLYDATAQRWKVDWVGLEEALIIED